MSNDAVVGQGPPYNGRRWPVLSPLNRHAARGGWLGSGRQTSCVVMTIVGPPPVCRTAASSLSSTGGDAITSNAQSLSNPRRPQPRIRSWQLRQRNWLV